MIERLLLPLIDPHISLWGLTGKNQFARIQDPAVITILEYLRLMTADDALVFRGATERDFNSVLRYGCQLLGLPIFTMHSLRHGRATLGFLNGDLPEVIRLEGRWAAKKSMELYLQAATSLLMSLKAPIELEFLLAEGPFIRGAILRFV